MTTQYFCCEEGRKDKIKTQNKYNGIDFIEVEDDSNFPSKRQKFIHVHFINQLFLSSLKKENIVIEGGERICDIRIVNVSPNANPLILIVEVDKPGDFSTYTLRLVNLKPDEFDPLLSSVDFSFKAGCRSEFDCKEKRMCTSVPSPVPDIDYLAKDFASFRQVMLDRLSCLIPEWKERHEADLGIALVELLAYIGDHLSYQQDAVATEAYMGTARRRISIRRHSRLVDYTMHEGCNARTWVQIVVKKDKITLDRGTRFFTKIPGINNAAAIDPDTDDYKIAVATDHEEFQSMYDVTLHESHNRIRFYAWSDEDCCLPRGATGAVLYDDALQLSPGDVLIFKEQINPVSGLETDADPFHRHAVRLTTVNNGTDPVTNQAIVEIEWNPEDALPFPFCISRTIQSDGKSVVMSDVSIALGNIVLADHGRDVKDEDIGRVPEPDPALCLIFPPNPKRCSSSQPLVIQPRFNPRINHKPLTFAAPDPFIADSKDKISSAASVFTYSENDAVPVISLTTAPPEPRSWLIYNDLLNCGRDDWGYVVEIEDNGTVFLRFGDNTYGKFPKSGMTFFASYRIGNGTGGNIGIGSIAHIISKEKGIDSVWNPLPAKGGREPEKTDDVRKNAPHAFRIQKRAVTTADYAEVVNRLPEIQRSAATLRWTGSWNTVFVTVDPYGFVPKEPKYLENKVQEYLDEYRMAGHDTVIDWPRFVPLEIELFVCVKREYFRSDVKDALNELFSTRILADGRRGVFHPDNFTFGQPVYESRIYQAALGVEGVKSVQIKKFRRRNTSDNPVPADGRLWFNRLEIARLDNDPNFPENGVFTVYLEGGR